MILPVPVRCAKRLALSSLPTLPSFDRSKEPGDGPMSKI